MKKTILLSFMCAVAALMVSVASVRAETLILKGFDAGDLVKLANDGNPATHEDEVVYYFDRDWVRHPFPNQRVFNSWYEDFSAVKEATPEELALMRLGSNIVYRPGTRLIKIPSIPKAYAVEPNGVIRWIESESVALALYGPDWAKRVDDVSEALFMDYTEGPPLRTPEWPTGTVLRRISDTARYMVDGDIARYISPGIADGIHIQDVFTIPVDAIPAPYTDTGAIASVHFRYTDTAQLWYVDTRPYPQMDFPVGAGTVAAGEDQVLGVIRITAGLPVIVRNFTVHISGAHLWDNGTPMLTDLKLVDVVTGGNLFGTKQLEDTDTTSEDIAFSGSYTLPEDSEAVIEFRAAVADAMSSGAGITVQFDHTALAVYDGGDGTTPRTFFPAGEFPEMVSVVE